jgi:hypothetical protein
LAKISPETLQPGPLYLRSCRAASRLQKAEVPSWSSPSSIVSPANRPINAPFPGAIRQNLLYLIFFDLSTTLVLPKMEIRCECRCAKL